MNKQQTLEESIDTIMISALSEIEEELDELRYLHTREEALRQAVASLERIQNE